MMEAVKRDPLRQHLEEIEDVRKAPELNLLALADHAHKQTDHAHKQTDHAYKQTYHAQKQTDHTHK